MLQRTLIRLYARQQDVLTTCIDDRTIGFSGYLTIMFKKTEKKQWHGAKLTKKDDRKWWKCRLIMYKS